MRQIDVPVPHPRGPLVRAGFATTATPCVTLLLLRGRHVPVFQEVPEGLGLRPGYLDAQGVARSREAVVAD